MEIIYVYAYAHFYENFNIVLGDRAHMKVAMKSEINI